MRLLPLLPVVLIAGVLAGCGGSGDKSPTAVEIEETLAPRIAKELAERLYLHFEVIRLSCEQPVDHQTRCDLVTRSWFGRDKPNATIARREVAVDIDPDTGKLTWRMVKNFT